MILNFSIRISQNILKDLPVEIFSDEQQEHQVTTINITSLSFYPHQICSLDKSKNLHIVTANKDDCCHIAIGKAVN